MLIGLSAQLHADIPIVPKSVSPNGKIHAVMDIDRDPKMSPEWKGYSFPQIEITEKATGNVLLSVGYFGAVGDSELPLREKIELSWRPDSKAFSINIHDRYYSFSSVFVHNEKEQFVSTQIPTLSYEQMTGFPTPDVKQLRPRGRDKVLGWDKEGLLIYSIFRVPLPTFTGSDPLRHKIYFDISSTKVTRVKIEQEKGKWKAGYWIKDDTAQNAQSPTNRKR